MTSLPPIYRCSTTHDITEILLKVALNTITIHVKVLQSQKKKIGIETRAEKQIAVYFPISVTENACIKDTTVLTKQNMLLQC